MTVAADQYYDNLVIGISPDDIITWQGEIEQAEAERMRDRSVMDILGAVRPENERSQIDLAEGPVDDTVMQWLQLAIDIQEKQ
jgi:hypothetical protein